MQGFHLTVIPFQLNGAIATINGGGDCLGLGGHFALSCDSNLYCACCLR